MKINYICLRICKAIKFKFKKIKIDHILFDWQIYRIISNYVCYYVYMFYKNNIFLLLEIFSILHNNLILNIVIK